MTPEEYNPFYKERDHGYGKPPDVKGVPVVLNENTGTPGCPHCGCERTFTIRVTLTRESAPPQLRVPEGYEPQGIYPGCAACPWAGPMIMTAARTET